MKTLYIECAMGAAGDMLMSALYELLDDKQGFLDTMNGLGLPGVALKAQDKSTCGISGTHMAVTVNGDEETEPTGHHHHDGHHHDGHHHDGHHHHHHASPGHIRTLIDDLDLPEAVTGVCYALYLLDPDQVIVSPVHVGSGTVRCAHGVMPVPAPATANLLENVPVYGGGVQGELCTPTGAALLTAFADRFGSMPVMKIRQTGVGIGTKVFEQANCVRVFLGETRTEGEEDILELICNIDDMTPEAIAYACGRILDAGALDAYVIPGTMKKGRSGHLLTVLCQPERKEDMVKCILKETTTNGLRARVCRKYFLKPGSDTVATAWGAVKVKTAEGFGIRHIKPEYEDAARLAREQGVSYQQIIQEVLSRVGGGAR